MVVSVSPTVTRTAVNTPPYAASVKMKFLLFCSLQFPKELCIFNSWRNSLKYESRPRSLKLVASKEEIFASFDELLERSDKPMFVEFYATWEELKVFSGEVVRFGNWCKDPQWHDLDRFFEKISIYESPLHQLSMWDDPTFESSLCSTGTGVCTATIIDTEPKIDDKIIRHLTGFHTRYKEDWIKIVRLPRNPQKDVGGGLEGNNMIPEYIIISF